MASSSSSMHVVISSESDSGSCQPCPAKKKRKGKSLTSEEEQIRKAAVKIVRIKLKEEKKHHKEITKAAKNAAKETRRDTQRPADRLRQMVLVLDSTLLQNSDFMEALVEELEEAGIEHCVGEGGPVGSVKWRRKQCERTVNDDAQISEMISECDENELLLTLEAQGFVGLIQYHKMEQKGVSLPAQACTLRQYVEGVQRDHSGMRVSLAVEGMDAYFRGNKTKVNRQFRKHVLASAVPDNSTGLSEVTWLDCQEAIVNLQLHTGCAVRLCTEPEQLAQYVITLTKAVSEKPFRKESPFSFHPDAVTGNKKRVQESDDQLATTWKNQLMQFNNVSESMALAVVAEYHTPSHLLSAYSSHDEHSAALLLQDIVVRRGVGSVASTRRLGPVQSRRIHSLLTSTNPHITLT